MGGGDPRLPWAAERSGISVRSKGAWRTRRVLESWGRHRPSLAVAGTRLGSSGALVAAHRACLPQVLTNEHEHGGTRRAWLTHWTRLGLLAFLKTSFCASKLREHLKVLLIQ